MIDFGCEIDFWWLEGIIFRKFDLQTEHASLIRALGRAKNLCNPVVKVIFVFRVRPCTAVCWRVLLDVAELLGDFSYAPNVSVPVVGGHSGVTIVPLLSQSSHPVPENADVPKLVNRIQYGGDEVVKAKNGAGSATLSMAYAGAEFAFKVIRALKGEKGIITPTFVSLEADAKGGAAVRKEIGADLEYFASNVELGPNGAEKIFPLGTLSAAEKELIKAAVPELGTNISTGANFITEASKPAL